LIGLKHHGTFKSNFDIVLIFCDDNILKLSTKTISFSLSALLLFSGCAAKNGEAPNNAEKTKQGVLIGTLAGAALGAITSKHHKGKNAAIGAAVGALAGGVIGYSLDKQADEIASSMNTSVVSRYYRHKK